MAEKSALIVDDSRTARQVLGRVLEQHQMRVEMAETAESALEYLSHARPDVIFMDHMMPGMDGFQAVRAIKDNPATATIPIMMYTSQAGELYVGQARALGAVGVLPKQIKPVEVSELLESLHLIPPRAADAAAQDAVDIAEPPPAAEPEPSFPQVDQALAPGDWSEMHRWLEEMLQHHVRELRADVEATLARMLDSQAADQEAKAAPATAPARTFAGLTPNTWLMLTLAGLAAVFLWLHLDTQQKWRTVADQNASLLAALETRRVGAADETSGARDRLVAEREMLSSRYEEILAALEWTVNQSAVYGPAALPLDDARLEIVDGLVQRLLAVGFTGTVEITTHVGDFCSLTSPTGELEPAPADYPAEACDQLSLMPTAAMEMSARQSVAFANYLAALDAQGINPIRVVVEARGNAAPMYPYPPVEGTTAGEWNAIARRNNRVEIRLLPDSGVP